jgi:hypothetical protein
LEFVWLGLKTPVRYRPYPCHMEEKFRLIPLVLLVAALASPVQAAEAETGSPAQPTASEARRDASETPSPMVAVGSRVRVRAQTLPGKQLIGEVAAVDSEAVTLAASASREAIRVPLSQVERIDVARGRRSRSGKGALIGALCAGIPAAALLAVLTLPSHSSQDSVPSRDFIPIAGVVAAAPGALVGAVVGSLSHGDRWERVGTKPLRLTVAPDLHGGVRVGLSARF